MRNLLRPENMNSAFCLSLSPPLPSCLKFHLRSSFPNRRKICMIASTLSSVSSKVAQCGYRLQNDSLGPLLKLSLYHLKNEHACLGDISGALLPNNRLHIETFRASSRKYSSSLFGVYPGMMLFIAALAFASDKGAHYVYGLAIDDSPEQHRRLVKYLKRFGGVEVQRVTDSLVDVPARMFYGGFGTIIRGDVPQMLERGQRLLDRSAAALPSVPK